MGCNDRNNITQNKNTRTFRSQDYFNIYTKKYECKHCSYETECVKDFIRHMMNNHINSLDTKQRKAPSK